MINIADYLIQKHDGHKSGSNPDEIVIDCPNCGRKENHFSFNVSSNKGGCFSCGWGVAGRNSVVRLIQKLENIGFRKAVSFIEVGGGNKLDAVMNMFTEKQIQTVEAVKHINVDLPDGFELIVDPLRVLQKVKIPEMFSRRRYPIKIIEEFELGFCQDGIYKARIIFPVVTKDKHSFVARRIHNWMNNKYKNPPNTRHSWLLYGYQRIERFRDKIIFICEGPTDVLRLSSYGLNAVATFGKKISSEQIDLLCELRPKEVISIFDADAIDQNRKSFERLSLRLNASYIVLPQKSDGMYYDPDNVPRWVLMKCFHDRVGMSKIDSTIKILRTI